MNFIEKIERLERFIGSLKFAVINITLFTLFMITGTFLESFYGTDFANRTIYKTFLFMGIQFGMLLAIIFAAYNRLPPKKRLYGFYIVHLGLVIIGVGSLITYIAGVDGHITLEPNEPNRKVILPNDIFKITYPELGKEVTSELPFSAFKTSINSTYDNILIKDYLPFAETEFSWMPAFGKYHPQRPFNSSLYTFKNAFAEQNIILTTHPEASHEFPSSAEMGPLTFTYYPSHFFDCFNANNPSKLIFWNVKTSECFTPEERKIPIKMTSTNKRFLVLPFENSLATYFPDLSAFPMDLSLKSNEKSPLRVFSKKFFEEKPHLFLFGKKALWYLKKEKRWASGELEIKGKPISLPWMGATLTLIGHSEELVPFNLPVPTLPIQKNGTLIKGAMRALQLEIQGKNYWVNNNYPLRLIIDGKKMEFEITKDSLTLPFELSLSQFKMDQDPGTNNPASYESFLKLFANGQTTNHHVFMNNPLKHSGYTFYQASYFQNDQGVYNSTLAVNVDQGRVLKYLGSLMLVLGAILHYNLNGLKKNKNNKEGATT